MSEIWFFVKNSYVAINQYVHSNVLKCKFLIVTTFPTKYILPYYCFPFRYIEIFKNIFPSLSLISVILQLHNLFPCEYTFYIFIAIIDYTGTRIRLYRCLWFYFQHYPDGNSTNQLEARGSRATTSFEFGNQLLIQVGSFIRFL